MTQTLTDRMAMYYFSHIWPNYAHHVTDGVFSNFYDPMHKPGDESPVKDGAIVFGNGGHLERQMELDSLIDHEKIVHTPTKVADDDSFSRFMEVNRKMDGATIYDRANSTLQPIGIVDPKAPKLAGISYLLDQELPPDYLAIDGSKPLTSRGARSDIAMKISKAYPWADVFTISASSYTKLGPGLMAHRREGKLVESWVLINPDKEGYEMDENSPWVDRENRVACLYRRYIDDEGNQRRDAKGNLIPVFEAFVDQNSRDKDRKYLCYQSKQTEESIRAESLAPSGLEFAVQPTA